MQILRSPREIAMMRKAGLLVWHAHRVAESVLRPGVTTAEIDAAVEDFFAEHNAAPLFKGVPGRVPFPAVTCISVNEEVVHGIPGPRQLVEGDIVSIDTGCKLDGWCGDAAVTHPVALFDDGKARHFDYDAGNGLKVRYFVLKSSDGVIRAAFDACDVCWPAGKGYFQSEDVMVCRNCGRQFASVLVNEVKGGCNPAPLNREVVDGKVVLQIADIIEGGKTYFDFSNRG